MKHFISRSIYLFLLIQGTAYACSVGGSVTGGTAICWGTTSGVLTLTGYTGTIIGWESASAPFTTWTPIANTSATYTSGPLKQTTQFRAIVQNGACAPATSTPTTVSMISGKVNLTNGPLCSGSMASLSLTNYTGTITRWEYAVAPYTTWNNITNTSDTYTSGALTQNRAFRVYLSSPGCPSSYSDSLLVTPIVSVAGTVTPSTTSACVNTPFTLTLSGQVGAVVQWEARGNTTVVINDTHTVLTNVQSVYGGYDFRATVQNQGCSPVKTAWSSGVYVSANMVYGKVTGSAACAPATTASLTVSNSYLSAGPSSVLKWQWAASPFIAWTDIPSSASYNYTATATSQPTAYRAVIKDGNSTCTSNADSLVVTQLPATSAGKWLGLVSSSWWDAGNWCGGVPTTSGNGVDVTVPLGTPYPLLMTNLYPTPGSTGPHVRNLTIDSGVTVTIGSGCTFYLSGGLYVHPKAKLKTTGSTVEFSYATQNGPGVPNVLSGDTFNNINVGTQGSYYYISGLKLKSNIYVTGNMILNGESWGSVDTFNLVIAETGTLTTLQCNGMTNATGGKITYKGIGTGGKASFRLDNGYSLCDPQYIVFTNTGVKDNFSISRELGLYYSYNGATPIGTRDPTTYGTCWYIQEETPGGTNAKIEMRFPMANGTTDTLYMMVYNTATNSWYKSAPLTGHSSYYTDVIAYNFPVVGHTGVVTRFSALPVSFLSLDAQWQNDVPLLRWKTASEISNDHFDIERSLDGRSFEKAGEQQGAGNSSEVRSYGFTDYKAPASADLLYYRLKQVDLNGRSSYSHTITLSRKETGVFTILSTSPNPFRQAFTLDYSMPVAAVAHIEVRDIFGKIMYHASTDAMKGLNSFTLPADVQLSSGVYFVRLVHDGEVKLVKVVKE